MRTLLVIRGLMKNYYHTLKHIMNIQLCVMAYYIVAAIKMTYGHISETLKVH